MSKQTAEERTAEQVRAALQALVNLRSRVANAMVDGDGKTVERIWKSVIRIERREQEAQAARDAEATT